MPLPRVVDGIWKVVESSRAKEEVGEVWAQQSIMRDHESACKVPPPPPFTHSCDAWESVVHSAWCHHPLWNLHRK
jgi:hypothetical protein